MRVLVALQLSDLDVVSLLNFRLIEDFQWYLIMVLFP